MGRGRIGTSAAIAFALSSLSHCVSATEIMVDLRTDVACSVVDANGVTIAVGAPNEENTGIATKTTSCDAGSIGTIALTPGGDIGGPVAVRVVLGVNSHADDCSSANDYAGCIVARRSLRYAPHTELYLPIDLDQDCLDNPCGPDSTCVHGSCTDAGVECDANVCGLDAGTPPQDSGPQDAGPCTDTPPTLISSTTAISTPRIARTKSGYAVAWNAGAGAIYAEIVDVKGQIVATARQIAALTGSAKLDAVATDDQEQNYFVVYEDTATTYGAVASVTNGSPTAVNIPTTLGPVDGAFWEASQSLWITGAIPNGVAKLFAVTPKLMVLPTPVSSATPTHFAVSHFGSTYYATVTESTQCNLRTCALQGGGTFACTQNIFPSCSSMRAAADAQHVIVSYVASQTMYTGEIGNTFTANGSVDDIDAMVPLVVGSTPYRVVWRAGGSILTDTFPVPGVPIKLDASAYGTSPGAAGFDAVADDPSQTGYAVVYSRPASPATIQFLHNCR